MRVLGCAVGYHHLCQRETIKQRAYDAVVVIRDCGKCNPFTMAEGYHGRNACNDSFSGCRSVGYKGQPTNVHLPLLPFEYMPVYLEADAFGLHNVQRFGCFALLPFFSFTLCGSCDEVWEEVLRSKRGRDTGTLSMLKLVRIQGGRLCRRRDVGIDAREIYVDDLARIHVHYRGKVL